MMKRSTKILMALATVFVCGAGAFAQRITNLQLTVVSPANGTTLEPNVKVPFTVAIKNNGTGNLVAGDTLFFKTPLDEGAALTGSILQTAINNGQTLNITLDTLQNNGTGTTDQTIDWCVRLIDPNSSGVEVGGNPFMVTYSDPDTTNNSDCNSITIKKGAGTNVIELGKVTAEQLSLYPNPANTEVSFNMNLDKAENVIVSVKDITGREVMRNDFGKVQAGNTTPFKLNVANLNAGLYFIELNAGDRKAMGKLTVSH